MSKNRSIVYFGFNNFLKHKRGVENVIDFQSKVFPINRRYYIHWDKETKVYKNESFICISIKHCWYWPFILNIVFKKLKKKRNLFIHSHNPLFSFFLINRTNLLTVHDGLYYLSKNKNKKYLILYKIIERLTYTKSRYVHFISRYSKEQSLFGNRKNFIIIPNTSHYESYINRNWKRGVGSELINVLSVRSIEERARIDLIIKVAEKLKEDRFLFSIAGKGPLFDKYLREVEKHGLKNVKLLGYVDDDSLFKLYSTCDLVLMTAEYGEGFGLPIIEGYLFGKPVVASNKCAIPEVIISNNYLFENEVDAVIEKIKYALSNDRADFKEYYDNNFSNDIILKRFEILYLNLI